MQNPPTNVYMEKGRMWEVVNEGVITGEEDDIFQYLKNEDVEIIIVQKPFHRQLENELLMQLEEGE
jgi:hypothetical protein